MLGGLASARRPAAKAAAKAASHAPAKREVSRKRSCGAGKPAHTRTSGGESASLRKGAPTLAPLRSGPSKKQQTNSYSYFVVATYIQVRAERCHTAA